MKKLRNWFSFILVVALSFHMTGFAYAGESSDYIDQMEVEEYAAETEQKEVTTEPDSMADEPNQKIDEPNQTEEVLAEISEVNPVYEELSEETVIAEIEHHEKKLSAGSQTINTSVNAAGKEVRQYMVNRVEAFDIYYKGTIADETSQSEWKALVAVMIDTALEHTGKPNEGDYLRWQYGTYAADVYKTDTDSVYKISFVISYYTTKSQENTLDTLISKAINSLNLSGENEYLKVSAIYNYVCSNVSYDNDHLSDPDYMLQYTAYAAMVKNTAVCQGYALLLYRLLLEAGIDNRMISGTADGVPHAWNIIQIGNVYYNADATWDETNTSSDYQYFLKSDTTFTKNGHVRDAEYKTKAFYSDYPMSSADYDTGTEETYTEKGMQYIVYSNYAVLVKATSSAGENPVIPATVNGVPVNDIRKNAFSGLSVKTITIPASVTHIEASAFSGCKKLTDVYYDGHLSAWNKLTIDGGNACLHNATLHCSNYERLYGTDRYKTALKIADSYKREKGLTSFSTIIVASGDNYPDALAGSYLAKVKNAPIILVNTNNISEIASYIKANMTKGGKVYLLGGTAVVPKSLETALGSNYSIKRLWGATRYETNIAILKEAGYTKGKIIVCTGNNFADSLSASATGYPILLVDSELKSSQKDYLSKVKGSTFYYIGGPAVVSNKVANQIASYAGNQKRVYGQTRYETSVKIASEFWGTSSRQAVVAYGNNFPDGLCGSAICQAYNIPLLLVKNDQSSYIYASTFGNKAGLNGKVVLGGPTLISDSVAMKVLRVVE